MKLSMCIVLCVVFPICSMDVFPPEEIEAACKRSVASHIISMNGSRIDASKDLLERTCALARVCSRMCCKGVSSEKCCHMHGGNRVLLFPNRIGCAKIFCGCVEVIGEKTMTLQMPNFAEPYFFNGYAHSREITSCSVSANSSLLAAVGGPALCVWDICSYRNNKQRLFLDLSQIIRKGILANHVALSPYRELVAVGVTLEKGEGTRCLVVDTITEKLLYNVKGYDNNFFYMRDEKTIANTLDKNCFQYDLNIGDKEWNALSDDQKEFLCDIYQRYEATKQKVCVKQASEWLVIYGVISTNPFLKTWLDERVYVENTSSLIGRLLGY